MKIICTIEEYRNLLDVITAGCCWIGTGENNPYDARDLKYKMKKCDIKKFKKATDLMGSKSIIKWEIKK
jgi:hypothetical protein